MSSHSGQCLAIFGPKLYDVNASLPFLLDDGSRKYVWGVGLAYAVDTAGTVEVSHADGLGSVRALTDGSGTVVQTYETDEFGIPTRTQGSRTQPFGYTGEQRDAESGFVYLRARMYDPQLGRFMQRDPLPGIGVRPLSLNRSTYVENNPLRWSDPSGLVTGGVCLTATAGTFYYGTVSVCAVAASNGDVGAALSLGGGGTSGAVTGFGVGPQFTTGNRLSDLNGPFVNTGASGCVLAGGGGDVFAGRNAEGQLVTGFSAQIGFGGNYTPPYFPGLELHGGVTKTWTLGFNVPDAMRRFASFRPPVTPPPPIKK